MKHEYTDTELQAAIDGACLEIHREHRGKIGSTLVIDTDAMPTAYKAEASARLDLIKSALAALPELAELAEPADPYAELKAAHAAGRIIEQIGHGSSDWFGCGSPIAWSRPPECYRIKPEPETFEAHGKVWTRHTPGDAMPCDGSSAVMALLGDGTFCTQQAEDWNWNNRHSAFDIIGWRYADIRLPEASQAPATEAADPADPYAELKKAHAAGKVIQINCCTVGQPHWIDLPSPAFFGKPHEYRIKPEPSTFEPTPEPMLTKPISLTSWTPAVGDVVTLKSGGPKMTIRAFDRDDPMEAWCHWFKDEKSCAETFPTTCLQPE